MNFSNCMPVNYWKVPVKRPKKCPWTQPLTCEPSEKSARERKIVPVKNFQKLRVTDTFEVHGKKTLPNSAHLKLLTPLKVHTSKNELPSNYSPIQKVHPWKWSLITFQNFALCYTKITISLYTPHKSAIPKVSKLSELSNRSKLSELPKQSGLS